LNGEKNARTPRARPVPRRRVTAASLRGVARSRDWIAAAAAWHRDRTFRRLEGEWKRRPEDHGEAQRESEERGHHIAWGRDKQIGGANIRRSQEREEALNPNILPAPV